MKKIDFRKAIPWIYAAIILALSVLFFTNDFGLVDIRKSSIIVGAGIDVVDGSVKVTAQLAVPQPAENGENTQYAEVDGKGLTVADALKEINVKTGFYPKMLFCKLILLGDGCKERDIFELLDYFYRNEYTGLSPKVAMCEGQAGELLGTKLPIGDTATTAIDRILSDEAKKSGNVSTVSLKDVGEGQYSAGAACYMPYITKQPRSGGGQEGGSSSQSGGGQGSSQSASGSQQEDNEEFICNRTAIFSDGRFVGVLTEEQSFALNLLENEIRHAFLPCTAEGNIYTIGLRNCSGGVSLKVSDGVPALTVSFSATAQIQDADNSAPPEEKAKSGLLSEAVLNGCTSALIGRFDGLIKALSAADCDALGVKNLLRRYNYEYFDGLKDGILQTMQVEYSLKIKSVS